jgi:hypothetical protein
MERRDILMSWKRRRDNCSDFGEERFLLAVERTEIFK